MRGSGTHVRVSSLTFPGPAQHPAAEGQALRDPRNHNQKHKPEERFVSVLHGEYFYLLIILLEYSKAHSVDFLSFKTVVSLVNLSEIFRNIALGFS